MRRYTPATISNVSYKTCAFSVKKRKTVTSKCVHAQQLLTSALNAMGVVWHLRSGTELSAVRTGEIDAHDGDIDIYVDMPTSLLHEKLSRVLKTPYPHISGSGVPAEVHWTRPGCPETHLVYNDWMSEEMQTRATHATLCTCHLNGVVYKCANAAKERMYVQYGPSWNVPLHIKCMDVPNFYRVYPDHPYTRAARSRLSGMVNKSSGRIEAAGLKLGRSDGMDLIVAQLNIAALQSGLSLTTP
jgi:hypothetical protein